nr:RidA family protein [uncultured Clostridium sp.]
MKTKTIIQTGNAPAAVGPYSQGVCMGAIQFISGQLPLNPGTGKIVAEGVAEQTEQCLKNLGAILKQTRLDYENVLKTTVLLTDIADFAEMNAVYAKYFASEAPARVCYQVAALPMGAKVEIDAISSRGYVTQDPPKENCGVSN